MTVGGRFLCSKGLETKRPMSLPIHPETRIGQVHLTVANLAQQIEFYRRVVGFKLHWHEGNSAGMGADEADLLVMSEDADAIRQRGTTGLYHFAVLYPDRRELARSLARLISLGYPNYPTDHLMTETTYLDDPEGNGIELYVDTPERGRWNMTDGNFAAIDSQGNPHSGREPLDVQELLSQLNPDDPLDQSAPPTTVMGHVHLHVSDLSAANRFYSEVLGFEMQGMAPAIGVSFVSAGGYHHHIGLNTWLGQGAPAPPPEALGLKHFAVVMPHPDALDEVRQRVEAAAVLIKPVDGGLLTHDPSMNGILLRVRENRE